MSSFLGSLALFILVLAVTLSVAVCATDSNGTPAASLTSYYFRAAIEAEGEDDVLGEVQGWYQAPDRWRWDFGDAEDPDQGSFMVSDGEVVVFYDRPTNVYSRRTHASYQEAWPPEFREGPPTLPASLLLGWLPLGDREGYLEWWPDARVAVADGGSIAGRETEAVRIEAEGVDLTLWIDRRLPFVLKYESRPAGGPLTLLRAEVMEFLPNTELVPETFAFEEPPGALEVSASEGNAALDSGSITIRPDSGAIAAPRGFLTPRYVPAGYVVDGTGETHLGIGVQSRFEVRWKGPDGYLDMVQQFRAGGPSETQHRGQPVDADGLLAYDQSDDAVTRLVFAVEDIVVTLESDALALDELVRVAGGLR